MVILYDTTGRLRKIMEQIGTFSLVIRENTDSFIY